MMGSDQIRVLLAACTPNPIDVISAAARQCYSDLSGQELLDTTSRRPMAQNEAFVRQLIFMGHESPLEHAVMTFSIACSRVTSHQLVRHRIASFSQQSGRYVRVQPEEFIRDVIIPPVAENDKAAKALYLKTVKAAVDAYHDLVENHGWPAEDARYLLPNGQRTHLFVTMNLRELRHVCRLRLCKRAQWEVREVVRQMRKAIMDSQHTWLAKLLSDAVPPCGTSQGCQEGKMSCGTPWQEERDG